MTRNRSGAIVASNRRQLEQIVRWAIKAEAKCRDDADKAILLRAVLGKSAEVLSGKEATA